MTKKFKSRFVDNNGIEFTVNEVIQGPLGLTVYYTRNHDNTKYSCLIDAFTERFKEIKNER